MRYLLLIAIVLFAGCTAEPEALLPPEIDFTGTWEGSMVGLPTADLFEMVVTQSGNQIAGTYTNNLMQQCSVSGTVSGYDLSLSLSGITLPGYIANINGTASETTASGTFNDNQGNSGTWSAIRW